MKKLLYFTLLILVFAACRKDSDDLTTTETTYNPPVIEVTGTILGVVVDENDQPVESAGITSWDGTQVKTDADGVFILRNVKLNQNGTYIKVDKTGYFHNSTLFYPTNNSTNYLNFKMISNIPSGSFAADQGGTISLGSGAKIEVNANSIIDENGQSYSGNVNVAITWLDPTADDLDLRMPGGLLGFDEEGLVTSLATYGMIGVELTDDNNRPLNLGNGGTADLSFPIPATLLNIAPSEIPLWHFDETEGIWKEEGKAVKQGNLYVGQVSHFSFWNCDAPFPLITLSGTVVTPNGDPIANIGVRIVRSVGARVNGYGRTDDAGVFSGKVPKDEVLTLEILDDCGNAYYEQEIGPFSTDTDIGNIVTVNVGSNLYTFIAIVEDCNNAPLTNGIFKLRSGAQQFVYLIEDGTVNISAIFCDGQDATYYAVNIDDLEESDQQTVALQSSTIDLGNIVACGNQLTEFVTITIGSESKTYISGLAAFGGTGAGGTNFQVSDSLSNAFIYFGVSGTATGNYDGTENFLEAFYDTEFGANGVSSTINLVNFDQLEITEYGAVGELIKGTFQSSNFEYYDNMQNLVTGQSINGSFSITRLR